MNEVIRAVVVNEGKYFPAEYEAWCRQNEAPCLRGIYFDVGSCEYAKRLLIELKFSNEKQDFGFRFFIKNHFISFSFKYLNDKLT